MTRKELGFLKSGAPSWKERLVRKMLRNVRLQGHTYVDLREDGKGIVLFCTLCLTPCYSDDVLFQHLRGNLHKERLSAAKKTLMGSNPWPFDDGVFFFPNSAEGEKDTGSRATGITGLLDEGEGDLAIVVPSDVPKKDTVGHVNRNGNSGGDYCDRDDDLVSGKGAIDLAIPGALVKDEVSDVRVRLMGYGNISARVLREKEVNVDIHRLWCEWLGKRGDNDDVDDIDSRISSHDFAIVTFNYFYDLGKQGLFDGFKTMLLTGGEDAENANGPTKRRKISFSDSEDASETLNEQCDISGEDSNSTTSSALALHRYEGQLLRSWIISSKSLRRELRKQQRVASEKMCDICQQKMLPGKDVAALVNLKTGRLALVEMCMGRSMCSIPPVSSTGYYYESLKCS